MKISELSGALLDYWVARAEGIEASHLVLHDRLDVAGEMCVRDDLFRFGSIRPKAGCSEALSSSERAFRSCHRA
ncbi:phage protein NinX family protein [Burkholderia ubonensis]|uniref:phage protein NinX family protein n=1 Tax=Burkholderia ubonensis TaxID=101571 RepID=UPI0009B40256|nr:phage protein NinX family protein [Burkholderia ubonensis]